MLDHFERYLSPGIKRISYGSWLVPRWAVQEQIDATVESAVQLARSRLPDAESSHCEEYGVGIPEARRKALPGVRYCVRCQSELEKRLKTITLYNRRGSKDSQLK